MKLVVHTAVPINKPYGIDTKYFHKANTDYAFDTVHRFVIYTNDDRSIQFARDDHDQWWFFNASTYSSLTDCKYARQLFKLKYMEEPVSLPLKQKIKELDLTISDHSFDKAFAHSSVLVENVADMSLLTQSRLANFDGDDDPQISKHIHYVENVFQNERTRFIAGEETCSFATVTENQYYFDEIHVPYVSLLYLQYFIYFEHYRDIPSRQMMPRLLANLWASKQILQTEWNRELVTIESLEN